MPKYNLRCNIIFEAEDEVEAMEKAAHTLTELSFGREPAIAAESTISINKIEEPRAAPPRAIRPNAKLDAIIRGGASYDRQVISTSVPPLEELNKEGLPEPGKDIL